MTTSNESKAIATPQRREMTLPEKQFSTMKDFLGRKSPQILSVSAMKHLTPERLINLGLSLAGRNPKLLECTPESILTALIECSRLGLEPTGAVGGAYLIPFLNSVKEGNQWRKVMQAQMLIGYQGLIDLACRTGLTQSVEARIVYEKDAFDWREGTNPRLIHRPTLNDERGKEFLVYARALLPSGAFTFEVLPVADIESRRNRSRAKDNGPWQTDYWAMGKKSAIRALTNRLPKSSQFYENPLARAYVAQIAKEEHVEFGTGEDNATIEVAISDGNDPTPPASATDQLADRLERKKAVDKVDESWEAEQARRADEALNAKG